MDKRIAANMQVKEKITEAFFTLLEEKNISEITITELINKAEVARSSFYRNYGSIQDVLVEEIKNISLKFTETNPVHKVDFASYSYLIHVFGFYYGMRRRFLCLIKAGFGSMVLQEITYYNMDALGDMPSASIDRYDIYYYSGALFSVLSSWLESGAKESIEEMAKKFRALVERG